MATATMIPVTLDERRRRRRQARQQQNDERRRQLMAQQDRAQDQGNAKGCEISPANISKPSSLPSKKSSPSWTTATTGKERSEASRNCNSGNTKDQPKGGCDGNTNTTGEGLVSKKRPLPALPDCPPADKDDSIETPYVPHLSKALNHAVAQSYHSPVSSVSFSQETSTTQTGNYQARQVARPTESSNSLLQATNTRKRQRTRVDSSSSEDSFDILKLAALKEGDTTGEKDDNSYLALAKPAIRETNLSSVQAKTEHLSDPEDLSKKTNSRIQHKSTTPKQRHLEQTICCVKQKSTTPKHGHLHHDMDHGSSVSEEDVIKAPRNPLVRMKAESREAPTSVAIKLKKDVVDHLWEDLDNYDEDVENEKTSKNVDTKKKKKKLDGVQPKKITNKLATQTDPSSPSQSKYAAQSMYAARPHPLVGFDPHDTTQDEDDSVDASEPKPNFLHPKFGPFNPGPLVVSGELDEYSVPASIARYLPVYQRQGIQFVFDTITKTKGAILGDDMGLGKTVMCVSLVAALLGKAGTMQDLIDIRERLRIGNDRNRRKQEAIDAALKSGQVCTDPMAEQDPVIQCAWAPILVMAPASVLTNWVTDFGTWGHFALAVYDKEDDYSGVDSVADGLAEILIVSHALFQKQPHFEKILQVPWKMVVIDEFHLFKNEKAIRSKNIRRLRDEHDTCILGLTGTVMQNNHQELWNLVDIVQPSLLGPWKDFEANTSKPLKLAR